MVKDTAHYGMHYLSMNSLRAFMTGIRAFLMFMLYFGFYPLLPVSDVHLARFCAFAARTLKPQSIKQYLYEI